MFSEKAIISKWVADIYDQNETGTEDVEFLLSAIGPQPKKILEVACGSGRILVPLAKAGHMVTGLDADECMLAKIPAKAEGLGHIQWRAANAVHDAWGEGFDVVVLAGNILYNIVSDMDYEKAQELLIRKAAVALAPGGCVYIDYQPGDHSFTHPDRAPKRSGERVVWEGSDSGGNYGRMLLLAGGTYDKKTRLSTFTRRFELTLQNGETIRQELLCQKHFATLEQIHGWLAESGFSIEQEYGGHDRQPIGKHTHRAIILARKA